MSSYMYVYIHNPSISAFSGGNSLDYHKCNGCRKHILDISVILHSPIAFLKLEKEYIVILFRVVYKVMIGPFNSSKTTPYDYSILRVLMI